MDQPVDLPPSATPCDYDVPSSQSLDLLHVSSNSDISHPVRVGVPALGGERRLQHTWERIFACCVQVPRDLVPTVLLVQFLEELLFRESCTSSVLGPGVALEIVMCYLGEIAIAEDLSPEVKVERIHEAVPIGSPLNLSPFH